MKSRTSKFWLWYLAVAPVVIGIALFVACQAPKPISVGLHKDIPDDVILATDTGNGTFTWINPNGNECKVTFGQSFLIKMNRPNTNYDSVIDGKDLANVKASMDKKRGQTGFKAMTDFDKDNETTSTDLAIVMGDMD